MREWNRTWNPWTVPNLLTSIRITIGLTLIALVCFHSDGLRDFQWPVFGLILIAYATDWLDGWIARRWPSQISKLGAYMDPPADKISVTAYMLFLFVLGAASGWFETLCFGVIFLREFYILLLRAFGGPEKLPVNNLGKLKTVFQMAALLTYGLVPATTYASMPATALLFVATLLTIWSLFKYRRGGRVQTPAV